MASAPDPLLEPVAPSGTGLVPEPDAGAEPVGAPGAGTASGGGRLAVHGRGSGFPVVFLHGQPGGAEVWDRVQSLLVGTGVRTLALLRRENPLDSQRRIKVTRPEVRSILLGSLLTLPSRRRWTAQFTRWSA